MAPFNLRFITDNGSFYLELGDGRWCRKLPRDHQDINLNDVDRNGNDNSAVYIGSINPDLSSAYSQENGWSLDVLKREINLGAVTGLTNSFLKGYNPLGVTCLPGEVVSEELGRLSFSDSSIRQSLEICVGSQITEVY